MDRHGTRPSVTYGPSWNMTVCYLWTVMEHDRLLLMDRHGTRPSVTYRPSWITTVCYSWTVKEHDHLLLMDSHGTWPSVTHVPSWTTTVSIWSVEASPLGNIRRGETQWLHGHFRYKCHRWNIFPGITAIFLSHEYYDIMIILSYYYII